MTAGQQQLKAQLEKESGKQLDDTYMAAQGESRGRVSRVMPERLQPSGELGFFASSAKRFQANPNVLEITNNEAQNGAQPKTIGTNVLQNQKLPIRIDNLQLHGEARLAKGMGGASGGESSVIKIFADRRQQVFTAGNGARADALRVRGLLRGRRR